MYLVIDAFNFLLIAAGASIKAGPKMMDVFDGLVMKMIQRLSYIFPGEYFIPEKEERVKPKKVDIVGFILLSVWLFAMQVVLAKGEQYNWCDTSWSCWLSGIAVFSFVFFRQMMSSIVFVKY